MATLYRMQLRCHFLQFIYIVFLNRSHIDRWKTNQLKTKLDNNVFLYFDVRNPFLKLISPFPKLLIYIICKTPLHLSPWTRKLLFLICPILLLIHILIASRLFIAPQFTIWTKKLPGSKYVKFVSHIIL